MTGQAARNDALIRDFIAAWERRDTDFIVESFADDGVYRSMSLEPIIGKEAIREFVSGFEAVPPGRLQVHHQVASDDVVMNERTDYITMNGQPVTLPIMGVFEMEGGRIKSWREYFDMAPVRAAFEG
jgi:limonene-1,2-epoxide hydrolase